MTDTALDDDESPLPKHATAILGRTARNQLANPDHDGLKQAPFRLEADRFGDPRHLKTLTDH